MGKDGEGKCPTTTSLLLLVEKFTLREFANDQLALNIGGGSKFKVGGPNQ